MHPADQTRPTKCTRSRLWDAEPVSWRDVLDGIDAVESWVAGQSYWVQVPLLLVVLLPLGWVLAGLVDRIVDRLLWPHTRREMRLAAGAAIDRGGPARSATPFVASVTPVDDSAPASATGEPAA